MSETMKVILAMAMSGLALAGLIINSTASLRVELHDICQEIRDNRSEIGVNRAEIGKLVRDTLALTNLVTRLEELVRRLFLPRQDVVSGIKGEGS